MSDLYEPLINSPGLQGTTTMKDLQTIQLDNTFTQIQKDLESFFTSKKIELPIEANLMFLSSSNRKLYIYSEPKILIYCIDTNTILSVNDIGIPSGSSITGNSLGLYLATSDAELFEINYDTLEVTKKAVIGKRNLFISSKSDEGIWAVSYGYTMYYYSIPENKVYRLGSFPWASGIEVSNNENYLVCYNSSKFCIYSRDLRFIEVELTTTSDIHSIKFSENGNFLAVAQDDGVNVWNTDGWTLLQFLAAPGTTYATFYGQNDYLIYFNNQKISV